jgi:hypothetical protein
MHNFTTCVRPCTLLLLARWTRLAALACITDGGAPSIGNVSPMENGAHLLEGKHAI